MVKRGRGSKPGASDQQPEAFTVVRAGFGQNVWRVPALALAAAATAHAQTPPPIDLAKARAYLAEDKAVTDYDAGRRWGVRPYGATFFVDPETRFTVANEPDRDGVLHADGDFFVGTLPQSVIVSNAPVEWEGEGGPC